MNEKTYIIKAVEEELGAEFFAVTVPKNVSSETVENAFEMGVKYANMCPDAIDLNNPDDVAEYDECLEEMLEIRSRTNGMEAFQEYMIMLGFKPKALMPDFTFEW